MSPNARSNIFVGLQSSKDTWSVGHCRVLGVILFQVLSMKLKQKAFSFDILK